MRLNLSESARVTTAAESTFRINHPNSLPRASCIIALDGASVEALKALTGHPWSGARFLRYLQSKPGSETLPGLPVDAILEDAAGSSVTLSEEIDRADVVVMIITVGNAPESAEVIGNACLVRGKRASALVRMAGEHTGDLSRTLLSMRPYAAMLVVSSGDDYIGEMLTALRA